MENPEKLFSERWIFKTEFIVEGLITPRKGKTMRNKTTKAAFCAAAALAAMVSAATERTLPTPEPGGFADTESSMNVPLYDWPELGRRVTLTLAANATPSNCVQIAFGQDTNGDENLAPEETTVVIGVDCGVPFARNESERAERIGGESRWTVEFDSSDSGYVFALRQPVKMSERFNFAKVTTRGRGETAALIAAEIKKPGVVLFVR